MSSLRQDLALAADEVRETHISWVFLGPERVWKVKKPVNFGFLDFGTPARRRAACDNEVRLNRRLAPDVYLRVAPVRRDPQGVHRIDGDEGETVDWAVEMVRLPDRWRADELLQRETLSHDHVQRLAERVARFHAQCETSPDIAAYGRADAIEKNVAENFEQTRDSAAAHIEPEEVAELQRWQSRFLEAHREDFARRVSKGHIRDGHGDLRLEHAYFEPDSGSVTILDCIEFNDRFRYGDVCADIAFLSMDLAKSRRTDLAEALLAAYARETQDYDLYTLVDFYQSYRAYVRAKVSSFVEQDAEADHESRQRAHQQARRYYRLALASTRKPPIAPGIIAVCGVIASGKSTIAGALARELSVPVVDADRTRKHMAGVVPTEPIPAGAFEGIYSEEFTERVYAELMRRARVVVRSGRSVIIEATFRRAEHREKAQQLARELCADFRLIECVAHADVCKDRLRKRRDSVSDGRLEIFDDFVARWEVDDTIAPDDRLRVDTGVPLKDNLNQLLTELEAWPRELTG